MPPPADVAVAPAGPEEPAESFPLSASIRKKLGEHATLGQIELLDKALALSERAHRGQSRADGRPYFTHPLAVADVLCDWQMDFPAIIAALLHDVVEDTEVTLGAIEETFGGGVALLVDGVSKIEKLEDQSKEVRRAESFRKILLAITRDWRVIFIKLADRLHNIRTLSSLPDPRTRKRIARETLDIYAPIADRLGLSGVCRELQNQSFRHLHPHRYRVLSKALKNSAGSHRKAIEGTREMILSRLAEQRIKATVTAREKNLFSVYRKMAEKRLSFSDVEDIIGFRIVVRDRLTCYLALGVVHMCFQPIPTKFDDYIAVPKSNGYQSLHTTVKDDNGVTLELQVKSESMHAFAEQGLAAHWLYKQRSDTVVEDVQIAANQRLKSLMSLHTENADPGEFLENVKMDLYPEEIYIMTPKGEIVTVPKGSCALDFAYQIHSDLGNRASFVRINGKPMPLSTKLSTGDVVEVVTSERTTPLPHWINFVTTARARSQIRHRLRVAEADQAEKVGEQLLISAFNKLEADSESVSAEQWKTFFFSKPFGSLPELHREIGLGKVSADLMAYELLSGARKGKRPAKASVQPIAISGRLSSAIRFAECCHPLPGEPIVGVMRKGRGLVIHQDSCPEIEEQKGKAIWADVTWDEGASEQHYPAPINVECVNQPGIASTVCGIIANHQVNIAEFALQGGGRHNRHVMMRVRLEVNSLGQCQRLLDDLVRDPNVVAARRARPDTHPGGPVY